jgi:acetyl esterase/lipase
MATVAAIQLEPAAQTFADATAKPPFITELGAAKGRQKLDEVQSGPITVLPADVEDLTIPGGPNGDIAIRIVRPVDAKASLPVILYLHGAGWVFGGKVTHDRLVRELAIGVGAAVVFPDFRRSPEVRYPSANEEAYATAEWIAAHGREKRLDSSRVALAGDSVGGNMAAALSLMSKQRGGPYFVAQVLFYPVTDAAFDTGSYRQFAAGYHLRRDMMQWFWDQYTTDPAERNEITASPLRASAEQLRGLPQALVITAEADVLRDEGEAYANKLREAGVQVVATRYLGAIHDFVMLNPLRDTNAAAGAIAQAVDYLRHALRTA